LGYGRRGLELGGNESTPSSASPLGQADDAIRAAKAEIERTAQKVAAMAAKAAIRTPKRRPLRVGVLFFSQDIKGPAGAAVYAPTAPKGNRA
jgi:hypothetical protein